MEPQKANKGSESDEWRVNTYPLELAAKEQNVRLWLLPELPTGGSEVKPMCQAAASVGCWLATPHPLRFWLGGWWSGRQASSLPGTMLSKAEAQLALYFGMFSL